jgi:WhiB family redox-sensing transcriptional regulator
MLKPGRGMRVGNAEWQKDRACKDVPTELFFPERGESHKPALAICNECPVTAECLKYALDHGETVGIYGATTGKQRRSMLKDRPRIIVCIGCGIDVPSRTRNRLRCAPCKLESDRASNRIRQHAPKSVVA